MSLVLGASHLARSFAGVRALTDASFELQAGEVHALVGENGAGKSTLVRIITGALEPDAGSLEIDGSPVVEFSPSEARRRGVAAIYQQPALFPDLTIAENIALGLEPPGLWRRIDWAARHDRARQLLERVGARIAPDRDARSLSLPEQQLVEIARAVASGAHILVMDEPTASLTDQEVDRLFALIADLRATGTGIIYISHRLDELPRIADRVTVLRDGRTIATHVMAEVDRPTMIRLMVGRDVSAVFPKRVVEIGPPALDVDGLGCRISGIHDVSFSLRAGEILGLAGLVGSGRTELGRTLFGITPADTGSIRLSGDAGRPVRIGSPRAAIASGVAYVPEDRRRHGVVADLPVAANVTLAILDAITRRGLLQAAEENALAEAMVTRLGVKTSSITAPVRHLSGGNQQKVALGRWLATGPRVLILDEPTQGVDVGAKADIHGLMGDLAAEGLAILMISSELPEVLGMSDRVAVMRGGTIVRTFDRADATPERVMAAAFGHD
jgi:rhamnose transport system ATP-binding protein